LASLKGAAKLLEFSVGFRVDISPVRVRPPTYTVTGGAHPIDFELINTGEDPFILVIHNWISDFMCIQHDLTKEFGFS